MYRGFTLSMLNSVGDKVKVPTIRQLGGSG